MTDESVFAAALAIPNLADRAAFLDRACAGNPGLRAEVDALLAAHAVSNPLDHPPADLARTGGYESDDPPAAAVGDRGGPYRLMEQIGEGGMGLVFVAEQTEPVRRKVALKVIKPGMDTRQVVARFEAVRQALALMDHPHIARVLDAGATPEGRPYFVMELVRGLPITDYCDQQKLPPRERLALFVQVCQAVQHAHQKGVIHRDIKPSNVLVAPHDGVPVVKVIDFGVAKAVGQSLTDKTIYTRVAQMIGTPLYMSPEQAELNQLDVDTRADVYALGVLLYELLAGTPPVEPDRLRKAALDEVLRIVRDEEPPRPSQRLSTSQAKATIAATRQTDAVKLSALMRGELDWIVMKALAKDRARRYDTPTALAKDVQRYLAGELVEARPPTVGCRLRKFARRKSTILGAVVFLSMLPSLGWAVFGMLRAQDAERVAVAAREDADKQRFEAVEDRVKANVERANAEVARKDTAAQRDELRRTNYQASIRLAAASVERGQVGVARELLDRTRPAPGQTDIRGFEWHYLRRQLGTEAETIRDPHPVLVPFDCAYSPDGRYLAVSSIAEFGATRPAVLWLWDTVEKKVGWSVPLSGYSAGDLAFTPDSALLALTLFVAGAPGAGAVSEVWLCDAKRGTPRRLTRLTDEYAYALASSPDGRRLAVLRKANTAPFVRGITTYDTGAGTPLTTVPAPDGTRDGHLEFDAAGRLHAAWVADGVVTVRDCEAGTVRATLDLRPAAAEVRDVRLGAGCTRLAAGTADRQVRVWNLVGAAPDLLCMFSVDSIGLSAQLHLSPDGRFASIGDGIFSSVVPVWEVRTGRQVLLGRGHTAAVRNHAFAPDGRSAASASGDGTVKVWRLPLPRELGSDLIASNQRASVVARPDGGFSAVAFRLDGYTSRLLVLDVATGAELVPPSAPPELSRAGGVADFKLSPDGQWALTADAKDKQRYHVTEVATGRRAPGDAPEGLVIARGKFLTADVALVETPDGGQQLWDVVTGRRTPSPYGDVAFPNAAASRDGRRVAVVRKNWSVAVLDAANGAEVRTIAAPGPWGSRPTLNGDGTRLALTGRNEAIVYDLATGAEHRLRGHSARLRVVLLSPDGRRVFTAAQDLTLKVWNAETGLELLSIRGEGEIRAAAVSADGHRLAVQYGQNGRGEVFDATPLP